MVAKAARLSQVLLEQHMVGCVGNREQCSRHLGTVTLPASTPPRCLLREHALHAPVHVMRAFGNASASGIAGHPEPPARSSTCGAPACGSPGEAQQELIVLQRATAN